MVNPPTPTASISRTKQLDSDADIVENKPTRKNIHFYPAIAGRVCDTCRDPQACHWRINYVGGSTKLDAPPEPCHYCKRFSESCTINGEPAAHVAFPTTWKSDIHVRMSDAPIHTPSALDKQATSSKAAPSVQRQTSETRVMVTASTVVRRVTRPESSVEYYEEGRDTTSKNLKPKNPGAKSKGRAQEFTTASLTSAPDNVQTMASEESTGTTTSPNAPSAPILEETAAWRVEHVHGNCPATTGVDKMCDILEDIRQILLRIERWMSRGGAHSRPPTSSQLTPRDVPSNVPLRGGSAGSRGQRRPRNSDGQEADTDAHRDLKRVRKQ